MLMPRMFPASWRASAASFASLTPPALPRPPACTCALTTTLPPSRRAIASASSAVAATPPSGMAMPAARSTSRAWYSWRFTHASGSEPAHREQVRWSRAAQQIAQLGDGPAELLEIASLLGRVEVQHENPRPIQDRLGTGSGGDGSRLVPEVLPRLDQVTAGPQLHAIGAAAATQRNIEQYQLHTPARVHRPRGLCRHHPFRSEREADLAANDIRCGR